MSDPEQVTPSRRQPRLLQAGYHLGGVWCVLFGKFSEANARLIGDAKQQTGDQRQLRNHAEQLWWDDPGNPVAMASASRNPELQRFEFEVTVNFCGMKDPNDLGRLTCQDRFKESRSRVGRGKKIYIFIMRTPRCYYEVTDDGAVVWRGTW
jgi:hypothetical protein